MKRSLLSCLTFFFSLYIKGIALLAIAILWPAHVLMCSRLAEAALGRREFTSTGGRGDIRPDLALAGAYETETVDAMPATAVLIEFAV
jgi:hypothetical protein